MFLKYFYLFGIGLFFYSNLVLSADHSQRWFVMWGYNRAIYQNSDIHFKGDDYDFTLLDVKADDVPSTFQWNYIFPDITIPQNNAKIGYYLDKTHRVSFAVDHMKYRVRPNQSVKMTGLDHFSNSGDGGSVSEQVLSKDYLKYEHTDGLNYINFGLDSLTPFWSNSAWALSTFYGLDVGLVLPRSNVTLGNNARYDEFHLAGYGASVSVGMVLDFGADWFVQLAAKQGVLLLPDVRTTKDSSDSAAQNIEFVQMYLSAAYLF
ncbi:MAG: hypothetical protein Q9N68_02200 [Gammaproteobacteria bacterium]|nr:hypothetical protein [Gammaproteobacteria bacterium]